MAERHASKSELSVHAPSSSGSSSFGQAGGATVPKRKHRKPFQALRSALATFAAKLDSKLPSSRKGDRPSIASEPAPCQGQQPSTGGGSKRQTRPAGVLSAQDCCADGLHQTVWDTAADGTVHTGTLGGGVHSSASEHTSSSSSSSIQPTTAGLSFLPPALGPSTFDVVGVPPGLAKLQLAGMCAHESTNLGNVKRDGAPCPSNKCPEALLDDLVMEAMSSNSSHLKPSDSGSMAKDAAQQHRLPSASSDGVIGCPSAVCAQVPEVGSFLGAPVSYMLGGGSQECGDQLTDAEIHVATGFISAAGLVDARSSHAIGAGVLMHSGCRLGRASIASIGSSNGGASSFAFPEVHLKSGMLSNRSSCQLPAEGHSGGGQGSSPTLLAQRAHANALAVAHRQALRQASTKELPALPIADLAAGIVMPTIPSTTQLEMPSSPRLPEIQMMWPLCLTSSIGASSLAVRLTSADGRLPDMVVGANAQQSHCSNCSTPSCDGSGLEDMQLCFMCDDHVLAELPYDSSTGTATGAVSPVGPQACGTSQLAVVTAFTVMNRDMSSSYQALGSGSYNTGMLMRSTSSHSLDASPEAALSYSGRAATGPAVSMLSVPSAMAQELHGLFAHTVAKIVELEEDPSMSHLYLRDMYGYLYLPGKGTGIRGSGNTAHMATLSTRTSNSVDSSAACYNGGHTSCASTPYPGTPVSSQHPGFSLDTLFITQQHQQLHCSGGAGAGLGASGVYDSWATLERTLPCSVPCSTPAAMPNTPSAASGVHTVFGPALPAGVPLVPGVRSIELPAVSSAPVSAPQPVPRSGSMHDSRPADSSRLSRMSLTASAAGVDRDSWSQRLSLMQSTAAAMTLSDPDSVPPWQIGDSVLKAALRVWQKHFNPLARDLAYLILCVPGTFDHQRMSVSGKSGATIDSDLGGNNSAWDRKTYCASMARMVSFLEHHRMWHTLAAIMMHAAEHGVTLKYQGESIKRSSITPQRVRMLLENALHDDVTVTYSSEEARLAAAEALLHSSPVKSQHASTLPHRPPVPHRSVLSLAKGPSASTGSWSLHSLGLGSVTGDPSTNGNEQAPRATWSTAARRGSLSSIVAAKASAAFNSLSYVVSSRRASTTSSVCGDRERSSNAGEGVVGPAASNASVAEEDVLALDDSVSNCSTSLPVGVPVVRWDAGPAAVMARGYQELAAPSPYPSQEPAVVSSDNHAMFSGSNVVTASRNGTTDSGGNPEAGMLDSFTYLMATFNVPAGHSGLQSVHSPRSARSIASAGGAFMMGPQGSTDMPAELGPAGAGGSVRSGLSSLGGVAWEETGQDQSQPSYSPMSGRSGTGGCSRCPSMLGPMTSVPLPPLSTGSASDDGAGQPLTPRLKLPHQQATQLQDTAQDLDAEADAWHRRMLLEQLVFIAVCIAAILRFYM